jgi:FK506-binding protein 1
MLQHSESSGRPFETEIGVGKVIKGWDEGTMFTFIAMFVSLIIWLGVPQLSLGEKATLVISPDYV